MNHTTIYARNMRQKMTFEAAIAFAEKENLAVYLIKKQSGRPFFWFTCETQFSAAVYCAIRGYSSTFANIIIDNGNGNRNSGNGYMCDANEAVGAVATYCAC